MSEDAPLPTPTPRQRWVETMRQLLEQRLGLSARRPPNNFVLSLESELGQSEALVSIAFDALELAFNHRCPIEPALDALAEAVDTERAVRTRLGQLRASIEADHRAFTTLRKVIIETQRPTEPVKAETTE